MKHHGILFKGESITLRQCQLITGHQIPFPSTVNTLHLCRSCSGTTEFQNYIDHPTPKNNEKYRANSRRNPTSGGMRVFIVEWHEVKVA